jgi:hypothetical protein
MAITMACMTAKGMPTKKTADIHVIKHLLDKRLQVAFDTCSASILASSNSNILEKTPMLGVLIGEEIG